MGQLLSHPIEEKQLDYKTHAKLSYSVGAMQGYRMSMEDAHNVRINEDETIAVFGVFDGHGGKQCAEYLAEHLPKYIFRQLIRKRSKSRNRSHNNDYTHSHSHKYQHQPQHQHQHNNSNSNSQQRAQLLNGEVLRLLKHSFFKTDHELSNYDNFINCGSTGTILVIIDKKLYVANTGDSRCIISTSAGAAKSLSYDQKPNIMGERVRIENSNGYIVNGRINEILALSRAFGDFKFKIPYLTATNNNYIIDNIKRQVEERDKERSNKKAQQQQKQEKEEEEGRNDPQPQGSSTSSSLSKHKVQKDRQSLGSHEYIHIPPESFQVTVEPDILIFDMNEQPTPEFIVMACDGIWDCFKNDQLVKLIRDKLVLGWKLNKIVEYILNDSLTMANNYTGIGFDNMTLIIIALHLDGRVAENIDEWYAHMIEKIEKEKGLR